MKNRVEDGCSGEFREYGLRSMEDEESYKACWKEENGKERFEG